MKIFDTKFVIKFAVAWCYILLVTTKLIALPVPVSNEAKNTFYQDNNAKNSLIIRAPDKSILHYSSFNLSKEDFVEFIQPTSSSVVLNRVVGKDPSSIFGKIVSNGQVYLVNTNGIYFGPSSSVNVGALVASTLDIKDHDFINGNYTFSSDSNYCSIINEGFISSDSGSIALLSSNIKNDGVIYAKTGNVVLATGEKITLDFYGDGLISFAIENISTKIPTKGILAISQNTAMSFVDELINTDENNVANKIIKQNGIIYLGASSSIEGEKIDICSHENSNTEINGNIKASNNDKGGDVFINSENIYLKDTNISVSGETEGGTITIGKSSSYKAKNTYIAEAAHIEADAINNGNGGKISLWSEEKTTIDGDIYARGGATKGNGGIIDTSSRQNLVINSNNIDTSASNGSTGRWLIDPTEIVLISGGKNSLEEAMDTYGPYACYLDPNVFQRVTSDVVLKALSTTGSITIEENEVLSIPKPFGISFEVDEDHGIIKLKTNSSIETCGGNITFSGPVSISGNNTTLRSDVDGGSGDITFLTTVNGSTQASNLTICAGENGSIKFKDTVGTNRAIGNFIMEAKDVALTSLLSTKGSITFPDTLLLEGNVTIDSTSREAMNGCDIIFNAIDGNAKVLITAGCGNVIFNEDIGTNSALQSIKVKSGGTTLSGNISAYGGTIIFESPVILLSDTTLYDAGPTGIHFLDTVNGAVNLTCTAPAGSVSFAKNVGATTALTSLTVDTNYVKLSGNVTATSSVSFTADTKLLHTTTITSPNITLDTVDGAYDFTLISTSSGTINLRENIGSNTPIGNFTISSVNNLTTENIKASTFIQSAGSGTSTFSGIIQTNNEDGVSLTGTNFSLLSGVITIGGGPFTVNHTGSLSMSAATDMQLTGNFSQIGSGSVLTAADITTHETNITFNSVVNLAGDISLNTGIGLGNITFNNKIQGNYSMSLHAGAGNITFNNNVGDVSPLKDITIIDVTNVNASPYAIYSSSFLQEEGKGTAAYGYVTTSSAKGISITSAKVTVSGYLKADPIGDIVLNAIYDFIGSPTSWVWVYTNWDLYIGANPIAYLCGYVGGHIFSITSNPPYKVFFCGKEWHFNDYFWGVFQDWLHYETGTYSHQFLIRHTMGAQWVMLIEPAAPHPKFNTNEVFINQSGTESQLESAIQKGVVASADNPPLATSSSNIPSLDTYEAPPTYMKSLDNSFIYDIDSSVLQAIVLQCLGKIDGVRTIKKTSVDDLLVDNTEKGIYIEKNKTNHTIDVYVEVKGQYGILFPEKAQEIKAKVIDDIYSLTGLNVDNVHVMFKKYYLVY
jgi:filamentous hemagglutinin family protein